MDTRDKSEEQEIRRELVAYLRKLADWKVNNAVKLLVLEADDINRVSKLDLTGVSEVKRGANGSLEVKCVDKVRVLTMLRELMEERRDEKLEDFLDGLSRPEDGDGK